ncbi:hypothetical protein [Paenibacillus anseongense]|uniref:hypothetical protein n=1 Tax=Paenibacillus anseongense TaxID=2682845 RepID=UPI002DBFB94A|nr:hypothetical protein [Paenibacillus anseongense]MEC0269722.1 hypothetical protein [Paenibacillus anseongense]
MIRKFLENPTDPFDNFRVHLDGGELLVRLVKETELADFQSQIFELDPDFHDTFESMIGTIME